MRSQTRDSERESNNALSATVKLSDAEAFVFDVDGTLVLSDDPNAGSGGVQVLRGAPDILRLLRARGKRVAVFTNGSGQPPHAVAAKLRLAGVEVADDELLTPSVVAVEYIRRHHPGQAVLAFGNEGVLEPVRQAGIVLAALEDAEHAGVVLIGADLDFTYVKLEAACRAVWAGAPLLVTSMAPFFASRRGRMPSPSGSIAAGIRHVTGVEPRVVGKPSTLAMEVLADLFGTTAQRIAVIGDDLQLEVRMAREAGAYSVLVLSGSAHKSDLEGLSPSLQPHLVVAAVGDLITHL
jgi:HAD superfamily hydrolase (TIGR01450 family)